MKKLILAFSMLLSLAASFDSGNFQPYTLQTVPTLSSDFGSAVVKNFNAYLACTSYQGSGQAVTWSSVNLPQGLTLDPATGIATGQQQFPATNVQISCSQAGGSISTNTFNWNLVGGPVVATGKFVDCSAVSSGDGSYANPWNSVGAITGMTTGQDLWFKASASNCPTRLVVSWSGTAADYATVGTYYSFGGVPYQLMPDDPSLWPGVYTWSHGSPAKFTGTYAASCSVTRGGTGTCPFDTAGAVPASRFQALVEVTGNFVKVQSIESKDSAGYGFASQQTGGHDVIFDSVIVNYSAATGILRTVATDMTVRNSWIRGASVAGTKGGDSMPTFQNYGACLASTRTTSAVSGIYPGSRALFEHNEVADCYGEGIDTLLTSADAIVGNLVYGTGSAAIYCERCQNTVIEKNIVLGSEGSLLAGVSNRSLEVGMEEFNYDSTVNIVGVTIRNNLIANTASCLNLSSLTALNQASNSATFQFLGNTCYGVTGAYINGLSGSSRPARALVGIVIADNVFDRTQSASPTSACAVTSGAGVTFHHNGWSALQNDTGCRGTGDIVGSSGVSTAFLWADAGKLNIPIVNNFRIGSGSQMVGAAAAITTSLGSVFTNLLADYQDGITYPCQTVDNTLLSREYSCNLRAGVLNLGALNATQ